jgi:transcriptional regulator with PAS, ATPase and Fis domain
MTSLDVAAELHQAGRFSEAFRELDAVKLSYDSRSAANVLKSELLQALGRDGEARTLATHLLKSEHVPVWQKSSLEYVLGKTARENGDVDLAIEHLQRSVFLAKQVRDLKRQCRAQLALMLIVSDRCGPEASSPLIAEIRSSAIKLGDARTTAALHVFVGETEAKRGSLRSAHRHASLALDLLNQAPNPWLESIAQNLLLAVALLRSDSGTGLVHGLLALRLAEQSGNAAMCRASLGNLGNVYYSLGEYDRAIDYFGRSLNTLPSDGETNNWSLESMARVRLSQGRLEECRQLLDVIEGSISSEKDRAQYAHRYAALTRSLLLAREGNLQDALLQLEHVLAITDVVADHLLCSKALLVKAELLQQAGRVDDFMMALNSALLRLDSESPEMFAQGERILGSAAAAAGDSHTACAHYQRAYRICRGFKNLPAEVELNSCCEESGLLRQSNIMSAPSVSTHDVVNRSDSRFVLQALAALLVNGQCPDVAGHELMEILSVSGCVKSASLVVNSGNGAEETIGQTNDAHLVSTQDSAAERRLIVGAVPGRSIEVKMHPNLDPESIATINAVTVLLAAVHELQRARAEREERATLWPADELPIEGDRAVVSGHMRDQMILARRVARANVIVLITGESGTGKEILANAIHTCSDRAHKPFVPVNCAAVPRELLESQLFGHRRGAFTGAERDHAGLIRAAEGGTLFLDEIGELGLDLQPKLLRFLESNEIAPLGETAAIKVNVRIVAATNKNLEDLVRDGRFREDLFYRLNVVPLSIKPLRERRDEIPGLVHYFVARAADECRKGHLTVAEETMERLLLYRWPGNVRQLQNELRRMVALAEADSTLMPDEISSDILGAMPMMRHAPANGREFAVPLGDKLPQAIARIECEMIKVALKEHHGRVDAAAKALGISRKGLYLKRQRLGL